jgi:hypothetical protein
MMSRNNNDLPDNFDDSVEDELPCELKAKIDQALAADDEIYTSGDVEINIELTLEIAEAAAEEALLD